MTESLVAKAQDLSSRYKTPFLLVDMDSIRRKYNNLRDIFQGVEIYYAMKANPHPKILQLLTIANAGFEVTSQAELEQLLKLKVPPQKIISLNPIKAPEFIRFAHQKGVDIFAFDSFEEVDKISAVAPKSKLVLRIMVDNTGSDWPLTRKFGIPASDAIKYLVYVREKNLIPYGLTFHVGSQCLNVANWINALYTCERIWHQAQKEKINLKMLSLGGGLPIKHTKNIPEVKMIYGSIRKVIDENFSGAKLRLSMEPGRAVVGDSAILVASVIGKAKRGGEEWIYLDAGVFNGLMETIEKFRYEVKTDKTPIQGVFTLAGPSCDSVDIIMENVPLPKVEIGDRVYFLNAGAYTLPYASYFNGFAPPQMHFV